MPCLHVGALFTPHFPPRATFLPAHAADCVTYVVNTVFCLQGWTLRLEAKKNNRSMSSPCLGVPLQPLRRPSACGGPPAGAPPFR